MKRVPLTPPTQLLPNCTSPPGISSPIPNQNTSTSQELSTMTSHPSKPLSPTMSTQIKSPPHFIYPPHRILSPEEIHRRLALDDPDPKDTYLLVTHPPHTNEIPIAQGSFGKVSRAWVRETSEWVTVKKIPHNNNHKNREITTLKVLNHPHCLSLLYYTLHSDHISIVTPFFPQSVSELNKHYLQHNHTLPVRYTQLIIYQLLSALDYLGSLNVVHRDIKPQNLLIDPATGRCVLADFGSAKMIESNQTSLAYICSRFYRAPELILGCTRYSGKIDMWSAGCLLAECLRGYPLFAQPTQYAQLISIFALFGIPSTSTILSMLQGTEPPLDDTISTNSEGKTKKQRDEEQRQLEEITKLHQKVTESVKYLTEQQKKDEERKAAVARTRSHPSSNSPPSSNSLHLSSSPPNTNTQSLPPLDPLSPPHSSQQTQPSLSPSFVAAFPPSTDPLALDLTAWMLSVHPSHRPTPKQALKHPFFAGFPENPVDLQYVPIVFQSSPEHTAEKETERTQTG
ncbi:putative Glycogen synthase kinase-3 [Blattamonas nauphoetae]|uniref:Glycogen synthase kinase-3 n=1 Tax=Blattamonas nauphoetae TaxID=2049346 RepID=A0ABQ9YFA2_9EUKA|nr:putative Glycogen synthase kinase-3 [Blattamonas nauphoetae]